MDDSAWENVRGTGGKGSSSGANGGGEKAQQRAYAPRSVPMHPLMMMERVKMVACSPKHTLLLSFHGSLFSCGENSEGALGVGDLFSRPGFTRITFAAGQSRVAADDEDDLFRNPAADSNSSSSSSSKAATDPLASAARIVKIAAGSSTVGSHSAALDSHGKVYVWGVAYAVGLGTAKPALEPKLLDTFHMDDEEREHRRLWRRAQRREQRRQKAAGGGSDVAGEDDDDDNDDVDDPADIARDAAADNDSVFGSVPCVDVACGGGFTLLVTRSGRVASCGVWSHGRLGLGPTPLMGKGVRRSFGAGNDDTAGGGGTKKLARYQLRPMYVAGVRGARAVAAGEAHALCATVDGALFAWGQNTCGQVGDGPDPSGFLRDHDAPCPVPPFTAAAADGAGAGERVHAVKVFAGAYHSVVIDRAGGVWTWGARGSPCLGHGDCVSLQGAWANKVNAVFAASTAQTKAMVPYELRAWCDQWSRPRRLPPLTHGDEPAQQVVQVAAGDMHTAFLTAKGALYLCGSGPVVPPFFSETEVRQGKQAAQRARGRRKAKGKKTKAKRNDEAAEEDDDDEKEEDGGGDDDDDDDADAEAEDAEHAALMASAAIVTLPRKPSASWLGALSAKAVLLVAASGTRCFAVQDEELVSSSVTSRLLRSLLGGGRVAAHGSGADDGGDGEEGMVLDDASLDTLALSEASSVRGRQRREEQRKPFYFEQRGRADCMLIASGKILLAHKAVLSLRSPALRDMIAMETEAAVDADGFDMDDDAMLAAAASGNLPAAQSVVKVLLPELHSDVAKALLCFLYTDVLPHACIGNTFMLRALQRAGHTLRVPRLQIIAQNLLEALSFVELELLVAQDGDGAASKNGGVGTRDFGEKVGANAATEMPPSTLARDMGQLLGEPLFADVRFLAEGRAVLAHKFLLESRSPYFRALFRSGGMMHQPRSHVVQRGPGRRRERTSVVDIVVPDTFVGFLRLLLFVYTDTLPDGSDDALLEDLLAADRYGLQDMKDLCESMLAPSKANWFNVLRAAELVNSDKLRALTASFLQDNFAVLLGSVAVEVEVEAEGGGGGGEAAAMQQTQVSFITFLRQEFPELLDSVLARRARSFPMPVPQLLLRHMKEGSMRKKMLGTPGEQFPWWALGVMFVVAALYPYVAQIVALGPVVPAVNITFTIVVVLWTLGCFNRR